MMNINWLKLVGVILIGGYFLRAVAAPADWHLIDGVDLIFHEAGHTLFFWAPEWLNIAGGSIFQVFLPLALAVVAWRRDQNYTAAVLLMWAGQSFVNVSVYAGDALKMQLPLISPYAEHDWNFLLWRFGLLRHTNLIAGIIKGVGLTTFFAGLALAFYQSFERKEETLSLPD
ncbi:MAG: hypothetical protein PHT12_02170 [Patescibacteria group bacterium]|nr:hypothetical protein [Patescibacteria group bacterium]